MNWVASVFIVSIFYSFAQIYTKYCSSNNIDLQMFLMYFFLIYGVIGLFFLGNLYWKKKNLALEKNIPHIVVTSALFALGTIFLIYSIYKQVNIGILNTVRTSFQIIVTLILGYYYLNETITYTQLLGVVLCILGITLVLQ